VRTCSTCGCETHRAFRYCPWCAAPQRRKVVEFFRAHAGIPADAGKALRVSRYLGESPEERHVRFSVWDETGVAEAAVSLDEAETARLTGFLAAPAARPSLLQQALRLSRRTRA
jgi:hypothetical protein